MHAKIPICLSAEAVPAIPGMTVKTLPFDVLRRSGNVSTRMSAQIVPPNIRGRITICGKVYEKNGSAILWVLRNMKNEFHGGIR
jgi:hypothetical protein